MYEGIYATAVASSSTKGSGQVNLDYAQQRASRLAVSFCQPTHDIVVRLEEAIYVCGVVV